MNDNQDADTLQDIEELGKLAAAATATVATGMAAAGCSGSSGGGFFGGGGGVVPVTPLPTQPPAPIVGSTIEASRFLAQGTFGSTQTEITRVQSIGYDAWINEQFKAGITSHVGRVGFGQPPDDNRQEAFFFSAVTAFDQLRQRVAFALGQIFVISDNDLRGPERTIGIARFHDILAEQAFGNFRDLLESVTLHPMMGEYLSMIRNEKPDPAQNIRPDENYAREVMQLFTIGLVQLNMDGTETAPGNVPTYDQTVIEGLAHVFTGWNYANSPSWNSSFRDYFNPMTPFESFHDTGAKVILSGVPLNAGQTAQLDLTQALDVIFAHSNVPPFISKQLIQRLVTSNPTPAYVQRVANVFASDENGRRGNLASVVRAILMDPEARTGHLDPLIPEFGKLREPLLRLTALWRAFRAASVLARFEYDNPERDFSQAFQRSPDVFNFYRPDFSQPGAIAGAGLVSPEFQIFTEDVAVIGTNEFYQAVFNNYAFDPNQNLTDVVIYLEFERTLANDPPGLTDHLNQLLMGGQMTLAMRVIVRDLIIDTPLSTSGIERVLEAVFIIITSPEFSVQR